MKPNHKLRVDGWRLCRRFAAPGLETQPRQSLASQTAINHPPKTHDQD